MALNSGSGLNSVFDVNYLNYAYNNQDYPWVPITFVAASAPVTIAGTGGAISEFTISAAPISGAINQGISGSLVVTTAADTMASSGKEICTGSLAATGTADTMAASAKETYTGTLDSTQSADTMAASATEVYTGAFAATENADTMVASGMSVDAGTVAGTFAATENADTMAASGSAVLPIVIPPDQSIGKFQWPRPKKPKQPKPYHIDWNAIEDRRSATFKQSIQDMFFPPDAIEEEAEEYTPDRHIAASFTDALAIVPPVYYELELLLLLA